MSSIKTKQNLSLENDFLKIDFYDPQDKSDPHFGTRYNHCGYISQITLNATGEQLLTSPSAVFVPFNGDGFPDEFEYPVGYSEIVPGETFIKLGVGTEKKLSDNTYTNWDKHPILAYAHTACTQATDSTVFAQELVHEQYQYAYRKTISLNDDGFTITHKIQNNGTKAFSSMWYSHCFFNIQNQSEYLLTLPRSYTEKNCSTYRFSSNHSADEKGVCYNWLSGASNPNFYRMDFETFSVYADCDTPCFEFQLYINNRIVSPEPKIEFTAKPGEAFGFSTKYTLHKRNTE